MRNSPRRWHERRRCWEALAAPSPVALALNPIRVDRALDVHEVTRTDGFTSPYRPLADAALAIGVQSLFGEDGGRVRRVPLLLAGNSTLAPGLALETARVAANAAIITVASGEQSLSFGGRSANIAEGGQMRIRWSDPTRWPLRTISAIDVLKSNMDTTRFSGAAVVIGSSAAEAGSLRSTIAAWLTPSVQIEAEAIEQLLAGGAPVRHASALPIELTAMIVIGLIALGLAALLGPLPAAAAIMALIAAWLGTCIASFFAGSLIDPVGPAAAALVAGNVAAGASFARTRRLKALIAQRFAQYLAPEVVDEIIARPDRLKRSGELRKVTALFTDVEGFTAMTNRLAPTALIALLDPYFDGMCRIALRHGGMIDAIAGDALHIFFNVPLERNDHVDAALDCALAIHQFAEAFCLTPGAHAAGFGRTRIGSESGPAIVGDVGGSRRLNFTAHGDTINLAARLEAANKEFGSAICVGPGAAAAAQRTRLRPLGSLMLRGFDAPVPVYTPEHLAVSLPKQAPPLDPLRAPTLRSRRRGSRSGDIGTLKCTELHTTRPRLHADATGTNKYTKHVCTWPREEACAARGDHGVRRSNGETWLGARTVIDKGRPVQEPLFPSVRTPTMKRSIFSLERKRRA